MVKIYFLIITNVLSIFLTLFLFMFNIVSLISEKMKYVIYIMDDFGVFWAYLYCDHHYIVIMVMYFNLFWNLDGHCYSYLYNKYILTNMYMHNCTQNYFGIQLIIIIIILCLNMYLHLYYIIHYTNYTNLYGFIYSSDIDLTIIIIILLYT